MSITLSKILARLYSLLSSHPAHYTATEYGSVFKTFFLAQTTVPRSERLIFHNVNACSDNFWMRNLFLSSSSSNPPLTPNWQIINNWDQLKLKKITVIVFNRKSVHALQEGWEKQKGDNIQLCCLTLILVILFIQVYIYNTHTLLKTDVFSHLKSHIPISGSQAWVPLNEHWAKTYVKLKTHTWLCPVNDRWRLKQLQFIQNSLYRSSLTEFGALLSAIWKQGPKTKELFFWHLENGMHLFWIFPVNFGVQDTSLEAYKIK